MVRDTADILTKPLDLHAHVHIHKSKYTLVSANEKMVDSEANPEPILPRKFHTLTSATKAPTLREPRDSAICTKATYRFVVITVSP
jgi:hypothetical protein